MIRKKFLLTTLTWALGLLTWGISSIGVVPQAQAAYFVTPDAYWQFSEATTPFADELAQPGNPNNAVSVLANGTDPFSSAPTKDATGRVGDGVAFGGTSGLWVTHDATNEVWDWAGDANFSIEIWVKRDPSVSGLDTDFDTEVFVGRNDFGSSNAHWFLGLRYNTATGTRVVAQLQDSNSDGSTITLNGDNTNGTNVIDNSWHQVVLVRDAVAQKDLLYVDGKLEDEANNVTYSGTFASAVASLDIGWLGINGSSQTAYALNGSVDQLALYPSALTATEIDQIYQIGHSSHALDDAFAPIYPTGTTDLGTSAVGYPVTVNAVPAANPAPTSYTLDATAIAAGMTVDSSGQVSWLPNSQQTGIFNFSVTAHNTAGDGTGSYTIDIVDPCGIDLDAYWHLEEDGTSGYASAVGTNLTGQCATGGCPAQDTVNGKVKNAQTFSGSNGINVPAAATADQVFDWGATDSFTVELWMKRNDSGLPNDMDTEVMAGRWDATSSLQWFVGVRRIGTNDLRIAAKLIGTGGENDVLIADGPTGTNVTDGLWHHVALVRDYLTTETRLYVDGALEAKDTYDYTTGNFTSATAALNIGHLGDAFGFTGSLDEVAVYGNVLDEAVILQHATKNPGRGYCNSSPSITSAAITTADPVLDYTYDADARDTDGDSVTWSLATKPAGMTIDTNTGVVSWAQSDVAAAAGTDVDVEIHASDAYGGVGIQTYTISVATAPATMPQITGQNPVSTTSGTALEIKVSDLTISDSDTPVSAMILTVMDGANYTRSGNTITPDASFTGNLTVPVKVNDGTTDSNTYNLTVSVTAPGSSSGGGGGGGGCFIESSLATATGSIGALKGFGILLFSLVGLVSATALSNRKNRIE